MNKINNFQVSAVEAKPSLITKMKKNEKLNYPSNKIQITINVDDDNDNSPIFTPSKKFSQYTYKAKAINITNIYR